MLCEVCHEIFRGSFKLQQYTAHHGYIRDLQQAALAGCYICSAIWDTPWISPPDHPEAIVNTLDSKDVPSMVPFTSYSIRLSCGSEAPWIHFQIDNHLADAHFALKRCPSFHLQAIGGGAIFDYTDRNSSMTCARRWLDQCRKSHSMCQTAQTTEDNYVPTRLLEIGQPDAQKVRLRLSSNNHNNDIQYATLSHCWGSSETLKLTSNSLQSWENGIEISELAQTFQDAIFTARSLDIHLLWIDSLCILQDSRHDWEHESALMSQVYRNSVVNIAATIAINSHAECFLKSDALLKPCKLQTAWTDHDNDTYQLYIKNFWDITMRRMPLLRRAWVVQELLLAPRVLHLCGNQLFWECYGLSACDAFPDGVPPDLRQSWVSGDVMRQAFSRSATQDPAAARRSAPSKTALLELWHIIVQMYTRCELTYATDKMVALSGVAKLMEQALEDEYCSGLWKSRLVEELSWSRPPRPRDVPSTRPSPYRAPSWSWACLDGQIVLQGFAPGPSSGYHELIDVIDCDIKTATDDRTGAVIAGTLKVSGWLVSLQTDLGDWSRVFFNGKWWEQNLMYLNIDDEFPPPKMHCLPLHVRGSSSDYAIACLLLVPTGNRKGQFTRYGTISVWAGMLGLEDWTQFANVVSEPWIQYESECGDGKYTISIV